MPSKVLEKKFTSEMRASWKRYKQRERMREYGGWVGKGAPKYPLRFWADHNTTVKEPDNYRTYISQPYEIDSKDILEMAEMVKQGWYFHIDGVSHHYPGRTIRICVTKGTSV